MQTFLPHPSFEASAAVLDDKRLGKQRVEAVQILCTIDLARVQPSCAWSNHPAVLMWVGFERALKAYFNACSQAWMSRGFAHDMGLFDPSSFFWLPPWFGDDRLHASHRAALMAKDPAHYSQFNWIEPAKIDYWWPTQKARIA